MKSYFLEINNIKILINKIHTLVQSATINTASNKYLFLLDISSYLDLQFNIDPGDISTATR